MSDETPDHESDHDDPDDAGPDPLSDMMGMLGSFLGASGTDPTDLPHGAAGLADALRDLPEELRRLPGMPTDPAALSAMLLQLRQMFATSGDGPVNWDLAHDLARQAASDGGDAAVSGTEQRQVSEALRTADLWLDRVTDIPSVAARTHAWSRAEWVEQTMSTWRGLVEPIATRVGDATAEAMSSQAPPEMRAFLPAALPMMRRMSGAFFGAQVGQAIGTLAREVVSAGDTGLPLLPAGQAALLPTNMTRFGDGLGLPQDEMRLYLALRESAHARLVAGVPWLRAHLLAAVEDYARGISVDTERLEEAIREIDPSTPQALQDALSSGLFEPHRTPAQQAALDRLELALALVEGWIDHVVDSAARAALPHAPQLREIMRRRRAAGGPAEHTFAALVGLELRPRRLREAATVWSTVAQLQGTGECDRLWSHPDLVPTEAALADPQGFAMAVRGGARDAMDDALEAILDAAAQDARGSAPGERQSRPSSSGGETPSASGPSDSPGSSGSSDGEAPPGEGPASPPADPSER